MSALIVNLAEVVLTFYMVKLNSILTYSLHLLVLDAPFGIKLYFNSIQIYLI